MALILQAQGDAPQAKLCLDELVHLLQGDTQTYLDIAF